MKVLVHTLYIFPTLPFTKIYILFQTNKGTGVMYNVEILCSKNTDRYDLVNVYK